ncbi:hypothetical protein BBOR36S_02325 [Brevibacillus borstelensis]|jgi:hypothetical protein
MKLEYLFFTLSCSIFLYWIVTNALTTSDPSITYFLSLIASQLLIRPLYSFKHAKPHVQSHHDGKESMERN